MKAEEANSETFHIGVVMIGFWDRIHMRVSPGTASCWARANGATNTAGASIASSRR